MNCYFAKAIIDNGRVPPHSHLLTLIIDEEWSESDVLSWAEDKTIEIIHNRHPSYGANYELDVYTPSEEEIRDLIITREKKIQRVNLEIEALMKLDDLGGGPAFAQGMYNELLKIIEEQDNG